MPENFGGPSNFDQAMILAILFLIGISISIVIVSIIQSIVFV